MAAIFVSLETARRFSLPRLAALPEKGGDVLRRGVVAVLLCCLLSAVVCGGVAAAPSPADLPARTAERFHNGTPRNVPSEAGAGASAQGQGETSRPPSGQGVHIGPQDEKALLLERPGLPNLHKVSDVLYRSAQPTEEGMRELQRMGVRTVISLRSSGLRPLLPPHLPVDDAVLAGKNSGLRFVNVPMRSWNPRYEDAVLVLRELRPDNAARQPVLIHCYHGADRTGMMIALYRIVFRNWSREAAIEEMRNGGYGHHSIWKGITTFIKTVDIDKLRADVLR